MNKSSSLEKTKHMKLSIFTTLLFFCASLFAQNTSEKDHYYQIPANPKKFTAETAAARMVDGLGFRYYWASADLKKEDLAYRPTEAARSNFETLVHIYNLTNVVLNSVKNEPNKGGGPNPNEMSYEELRAGTLNNLKKASTLLKNAKKKAMKGYQMSFIRDNGTVDYPFWNVINGPLSDAIYHTGQVVTLRRSSGNPINPNISVLQGIVRTPANN